MNKLCACCCCCHNSNDHNYYVVGGHVQKHIRMSLMILCQPIVDLVFFFNSSPLMNHSKITSKLDLNYYIPLSCAPIGICTVRQEENPTHSYIISLKEFSGHLQEFELTIIIGFVSIITLSFENPLEVLLRSNFSKNYYTILWFMT